MATEKAIFSLFHIPPSCFVIQKGWPFFCHKLEIRVIVVEHADGPSVGVRDVHGGASIAYPSGSASNASRCFRGIRNLAVAWCSIPLDSLGRVAGIGIPRSWSMDGCRYRRIVSRTALVPFTRACVAALEI